MPFDRTPRFYPNLSFGGSDVAMTLDGRLGCNDLKVEKVVLTNKHLTLIDASQTLIACTDQVVRDAEHTIREVLDGAPSVEIVGDVLTLTHGGNLVYRR